MGVAAHGGAPSLWYWFGSAKEIPTIPAGKSPESTSF
jgi:hypothetical protein